MIARVLRTAIVIVVVLTAKGTFASTTPTIHYISKSLGADTNGSTSKATPWAHLPGMQSCTSNCSSYTPVAGDQFILYGGDTWTASDLGIIWRQSGTASNPIYIGVDQTWYNSGVCGSSFCRPIFTCNGAACAGTGNATNYMFIDGSYVTVDNIEFTGLFSTGNDSSVQYVTTQLDHDVVEHCYFHGWTIQTGSLHDVDILTSFNNNSFAPYSSVGSGLFYSVIDGSDTALNSMQAVGGNPTYIVGNVIQYVSNALDNIGATFVHDNYFGPVVLSFQAGAHQNVVALGGSDNGETNQFVYNNVITGTTCGSCGGVVKLWLDQYNAPTSNVGYAFNNVIYNNAPGNLINQGHGFAGQTYWSWFFFNNTVECGMDSNTGACISDMGAAGGTATLTSINNHWITSQSGPAVSCSVYTCTSTTDLSQTLSVGNRQGYSSSQIYAFSPTSASSPTVNVGTNKQSLCATISALDATAGAACQNDTGYACQYNTSNHSVICPSRAQFARPSGAWDIGAYQFSTSQSSAPQPPTNLQVSVH